MPEPIRIALVGDYDSAVTAHRAIPEALRLSAARLGVGVRHEWVHTTRVGTDAVGVAGAAGVWCVPASPYADADGALAAIRHARVSRVPFLGTCGGFQHAVVEYARVALGLRAADHAETAPDAAVPVIAPLACALVGRRGVVEFTPGSRVATAYGADRAEEDYHCRYGPNPAYEWVFADPAGLHVAARDTAGEVRAAELGGHPFFVGTLYQPERAALRGEAHPLVTAFVAAAAGR
jgi:CTP synthase (UTP-ammonia lyase)